MRINSSPARRVRAGVVAVAAAAVLVTSACSGASDDAEANGSTEPEATSDAPTTLTVAVSRQPQGFDTINLSNGTDALVWSAIYDRLIVPGDDGLPVPAAAESWEYSEDGLVLTLHLRDGMTFSNGDPVVAADYKATLDLLISTAGPLSGEVGSVSSVEAPDDSTIVINFSQPDASFLDSLSKAIGAIANDTTIANEDAPTNPVGSGAYTLDPDATVAGSQYVLNKREDYWNADAYPFETVTVKVIADSTALENALKSGEINVGDVISGTLDESSGITATEVPGAGLQNLKILDREGTIVPALADVRVRQAINYAINRDAIVEGVSQGRGEPVAQIAFPDTSVYVEELNDTYPYDLEKAKELMAEAGYADGFAVTMPSIIYSQTLDPVVGQALADIGITVTWDSIPAQNTGQAILSAQYPMAIWPDGYAGPARLFGNQYTENAFQNPFHTTDDELTALLNDLATTVDPEAQIPLAKEVNAWVVENAWDAPILNSSRLIGVHEGYAYTGTTTNSFPSVALYGVAE